MTVKISRLAEGRHKTDPGLCPKCGLSINTVSGLPGGTLQKEDRSKDAVRIMICARCEVAIARWDDKILALDAQAENLLDPEARAALWQTRQKLRFDKLIGRIIIPAEGP